jgi:FkbM family methyltransferase
MRILGRRPGRLLAAAGQLPGFAVAAARCVRLFRRPHDVLAAYIRRSGPASRRVELRDGLVMHLSGDSSDIVTVFLVFCRHDYGIVERGSVVVDIGANIGIFALYAAWCGATEVRAYEPSAESFACLERNIRDNNLGGVIHARRAAVMGRPSAPVLFPRGSSVFNAIQSDGQADAGAFDRVPVAALEDVVSDLPRVDLMKLDCEGGEYDILLNAPRSLFDRVRAMKLEYHQGPQQDLMKAIDAMGFKRRQFMDEGEGGGYLWLVR